MGSQVFTYWLVMMEGVFPVAALVDWVVLVAKDKVVERNGRKEVVDRRPYKHRGNALNDRDDGVTIDDRQEEPLTKVEQ